MPDTKASATSVIENEIASEQLSEIDFNNQHPFLSINSIECNVDYDDTLSVAYTSSETSSIVCSSECSEPNIRPNIVDPSNVHFGSVSVENSTNVTVGNQMYFQGPVAIATLVVDGNNVDRSVQSDEINFLNERIVR